MSVEKTLPLILVAIVAALGAFEMSPKENTEHNAVSGIDSEMIKLPKPASQSKTSMEEALLKRRSIREYKNQPLTISEVSQLLWAAQGVTDTVDGLRTAPSAGALYPLELYLAVGNVDGIAKGIYKYKPHEHGLVKIADRDVRDKLSRAALGQSWVADNAVVLVLAAVFERTTLKYGQRGKRYVHIEVGHAAQNVYLQVVSLNLGTVIVGTFQDDEVKKIMMMEDLENPMCIMPIGRK